MTAKSTRILFSALVGAGILVLALILAPPLAFSHQDRGHQDRGRLGSPGAPFQGGPGSRMGPCYDEDMNPDNLETVRGTALKLDRYDGRQGVILWLQTGQETLEVHLGPDWYLDSQGFELAPNSPIEVTGFRSERQGQGVLIASEVKQGNQVLPLRDENGYPLWMLNTF